MAVSVRNFIESLFHNIWNVNSILILIVSASKSLSQARKIEHGDVGYTVKNRNCSPLNAFSVYGIIGSRLDGDQIRLSISVFTGIITRNPVFKWNFKLYEDSFDMYKEHNDTSDDVNDMGEALEAAG